MLATAQTLLACWLPPSPCLGTRDQLYAATFFDDGFLGRGVSFEHGVKALAAAAVRGSIDAVLQVTVIFDEVRGSVRLVVVEGRVLLTSTLRVRLAFGMLWWRCRWVRWGSRCARFD
jgi:hypothetical protein